MTIVETTASSDPSEISGTRSAEATTVRIQGNRAETRARRAASRSIAYTGRRLVDETRPHERGEERPVTAAEVGERERPRRQRTREQRRHAIDVEVDRRLGVPLAHASEVTRRPAGSRPSRPRNSPL